MKKLNDLINNLETYKELTTVPRDTLIKELKECRDELYEQLSIGDVSLCPDCKGTGTVVNVRHEPRCCGNLNEYGGCCNYPVLDQIAKLEQCERCEATGQH